MNEEIEDWHPDARIDAIGLRCPLPVLKARKRLAAMAAGEILFVAASDPMASIDLPHLCREDGHKLLAQRRVPSQSGEALHFLIRKGPAATSA